MPFRERVKRVFGRKSSQPSEGSDAKKEDKKSKKKKKADEWEDWPEHIYKPHEMPRPKYRRPPEPGHKATLESYSWDSNTPPEEEERRKSHGSLYSPMGSKMPSRMNSIVSKLIPSRGGSRAPSVVEEGEGEGDVGNVGLSRIHTHGSHSSRGGRRHSARFSFSRPGTSTAAEHQPLQEHPSAERSNSETAAEAKDTQNSNGADLENVETVTEASERKRRDRADTIRQEPFDQAELARKLTTLRVDNAGPSAVAAH